MTQCIAMTQSNNILGALHIPAVVAIGEISFKNTNILPTASLFVDYYVYIPINQVFLSNKRRPNACLVGEVAYFPVICKNSSREDIGCFFLLHWYPPKKLKYGKPRFGESTLT